MAQDLKPKCWLDLKNVFEPRFKMFLVRNIFLTRSPTDDKKNSSGMARWKGDAQDKVQKRIQCFHALSECAAFPESPCHHLKPAKPYPFWVFKEALIPRHA